VVHGSGSAAQKHLAEELRLRVFQDAPDLRLGQLLCTYIVSRKPDRAAAGNPVVWNSQGS
jgi:hypothetical protein